MNKKLYIAYGSNLHRKGMRQRCPDARPLESIWLSDARLVFRGVADVVPEKGQLVPAGLWEISERDEEALDRYEGVKSGLYDRFWVPVRNHSAKALLYMMSDRRGIYPPSSWYAAVIRDGYRHFELDESFLTEAIQHSYANMYQTEQTKSRRKRQLASGYQGSLVKLPASLKPEKREEDYA